MKQPYKAQARQQREAAILQAAKHLIIHRGFANFSMDDLAEEVGISKPTLYQHFKSKNMIAVRVVQQDYQGVKSHLAAPPVDSSPLKQINSLLAVLLRSHYEIGSTIAGLSPDVISIIRQDETFIALRQQTLAHLAALVDAAKAQGEIVPDLPTEIVVRTIFYLQGAIRDNFSKTPPTTDAAPEAYIEHVIRIFTQGVTPR